jgi:uncharacterized DUF497 family protein
MEYEWDEKKSRWNDEERGFGFEIAMTAFRDPDAVGGGPHVVKGEERHWLVGKDLDGDLLFVVYTWRHYGNETRCRIISARKASRKERSRYSAVSELGEGQAGAR